uniref:Secreted RxLR effector peptide protein n=1 Tax=Panagrellus redivivus TaxID=6233 RepID=A0A7E4W9U1_PANRE
MLLRLMVLWVSLAALGLAEVSSASGKHHGEEKVHSNVETKSDVHGEVDPMKMYQRMLKKKRLDMTAAVRSLAAVKDNAQRKSMVDELVTSMHSVIAAGKTAIETAKFDAHSQQFPIDEVLRDHVAGVLENTPFLYEFALYYPKLVKKLYKIPNFADDIKWAYVFVHDFGVYDEETLKMLDLAGQELLVIPRRGDFVNPYDKLSLREQMQWEAVEAAKAEKEAKKQAARMDAKSKKKVDKGPRISKGEL